MSIISQFKKVRFIRRNWLTQLWGLVSQVRNPWGRLPRRTVWNFWTQADSAIHPQVEFLHQGSLSNSLQALQLIESGPPRLSRIISLEVSCLWTNPFIATPRLLFASLTVDCSLVKLTYPKAITSG